MVGHDWNFGQLPPVVESTLLFEGIFVARMSCFTLVLDDPSATIYFWWCASCGAFHFTSDFDIAWCWGVAFFGFVTWCAGSDSVCHHRGSVFCTDVIAWQRRQRLLDWVIFENLAVLCHVCETAMWVRLWSLDTSCGTFCFGCVQTVVCWQGLHTCMPMTACFPTDSLCVGDEGNVCLVPRKKRAKHISFWYLILAKLSSFQKPVCDVCARKKFEVGKFCASVPSLFDEVPLEHLGNIASYHNNGGAEFVVATKTMHVDNEKPPECFCFRDFTGKSGLGRWVERPIHRCSARDLAPERANVLNRPSRRYETLF